MCCRLGSAPGSLHLHPRERSVRQPALVNIELFEVIDDPDTQKLYLVLEYMSGGQIMEWNGEALEYECAETKKPLTEEMAKYYMHDVVVGLDYLHSNFIAHRDLKPENILQHADGHAVMLPEDEELASSLQMRLELLKRT